MDQNFAKGPHRFVNNFAAMVMSVVVCIMLAACGGGGSSGSGSGSSSGGSSSGGSSSGGGSSSSGANPCTPYAAAAPSANNVVNVSVDCAVFGGVNEPFVTVKICSTANTSSCLSIDHILVDTGSVGLRVFAAPTGTAALSTIGLTAPNSGQIGECLQFVQGNTWGSVKMANIQIGGAAASNVAIQVIADPNFASVPAACTNSSASGTTVMSTPTEFGANGVLGIGLQLQDCGSACTQPYFAGTDVYFNCTSTTSTSCTNVGMPIANQIQNPASLFSTGSNNGVILSLNAIAASGAATAGGTLTFGIASAPTNTIPVDSNTGAFVTTFEGQTYDNSYIDSGSNGFYFNPPTNDSITACTGQSAGFYCPASVLNTSGQMITNVGVVDVNFSVANAVTLFATDGAAYTSLAGTAANVPGIGNGYTFDWGLPFFFGKNVYVGFEDSNGNNAYFGF